MSESIREAIQQVLVEKKGVPYALDELKNAIRMLKKEVSALGLRGYRSKAVKKELDNLRKAVNLIQQHTSYVGEGASYGGLRASEDDPEGEFTISPAKMRHLNKKRDEPYKIVKTVHPRGTNTEATAKTYGQKWNTDIGRIRGIIHSSGAKIAQGGEKHTSSQGKNYYAFELASGSPRQALGSLKKRFPEYEFSAHGNEVRVLSESSIWVESFAHDVFEATDPPMLKQFRKIVKSKSAGKVGGQMVDMFSASAVVEVYDKLNPVNKKKLANMSPMQAITTALKVIDRSR